MDDTQIIELYLQRNETAIAETAQKYGEFCYRIAKNILSSSEEAQECVNDAWHQAWNTIPPQHPTRFKPWLGKVVRNLAINRWHKNHTQKRYACTDQLLSELEDCLPSAQTVEREIEQQELVEQLNHWLRSLQPEDRALFIRRYWNGVALNALAKEWNISPNKLAQRMYRLRQSLKAALEKEDIML